MRRMADLAVVTGELPLSANTRLRRKRRTSIGDGAPIVDGCVCRAVRSKLRRPLCQFGVKFRQHDDTILIAAGGMHDDPGASLTALVPWRMRNVGGDKTLLSRLHVNAVLQIVAIIDCAFPFDHVGDGLDTLVIMRLRDRAGHGLER